MIGIEFFVALWSTGSSFQQVEIFSFAKFLYDKSGKVEKFVWFVLRQMAIFCDLDGWGISYVLKCIMEL